MDRARIGLGDLEGGTAHFSYNFGDERQQSSVLFEPSNRDRQRIFLRFQSTYTIQPKIDHDGRVIFDQFNIGPLLTGHATTTRNSARQQLQRTLNAIKYTQE